MMRQTILSVLAVALLAAPATADTIYVCWDGSGEYLTIQEGIDAANNGDEVVVCAGTYNEVINFNGKAITLRSSEGPDVTTIDGTRLNDSVVKCRSGEGPDTVLDGFTITGGTGDPIPTAVGGGMLNWGSSPAVMNCIFFDNHTVGSGGGMYNNSSSPTVNSCTFSNNTSGDYGGGVAHWEYSAPIFTECTFTGNSAPISGGGMMSHDSSTPTLINCTFSGNIVTHYSAGPRIGGGGMSTHYSANAILVGCTFDSNHSESRGGAIMIVDSQPTISNCTFRNNSASFQGGAIHNSGQYIPSTPSLINCTFSGNTASGGGAMDSDNSTPTLANCIIWDNSADPITGPTTVTYSDVQGGFTGTGNIDADPLFVDAANGDLHLSRGSPCIDAGDNTALPPEVTTDLDGNPRFVDDPGTPDTGNGMPPIVDMGAYELQVLLGDLNCDGQLDAFDIDPFVLALTAPSQYALEYPDCHWMLADINGDGYVDAFDLDPFVILLTGG